MSKFNQKGIIQAVLVVVVVVAAAAALGTGIYLNKLTAKLDSSGSLEDQNEPFTNNTPVISQIPQFAGGSAATPAPTSVPTFKPEATAKPAPTPATSAVPAKTESCPKKETLACFSTSPICKKFSSPCTVPAGWRVVGD